MPDGDKSSFPVALLKTGMLPIRPDHGECSVVIEIRVIFRPLIQPKHRVFVPDIAAPVSCQFQGDQFGITQPGNNPESASPLGIQLQGFTFFGYQELVPGTAGFDFKSGNPGRFRGSETLDSCKSQVPQVFQD